MAADQRSFSTTVHDLTRLQGAQDSVDIAVCLCPKTDFSPEPIIWIILVIILVPFVLSD